MQAQQIPNQRLASRFALTPLMQQSLRLLTMRNHQVAALMRGMAERNPYLEVHDPKSPARASRHDELLQAFSPAMARDRPEQSLTGYLFDQIALVLPPGHWRGVALALVAHVTPAGYLEPEAVNTAAAMGVSGDAFERLLGRLHTIEPTGIFARDLAECLTLQLRERNEYDDAMARLIGHLPRLTESGLEGMARAMGEPIEEVARKLERIKRLDPKPGARFHHDEGEIYRPDLLIERRTGHYDIALNHDTLPTVKVADDLSAHEKTGTPLDEDTERWLAAARREAAILASAFAGRARMLLALGGLVVARQSAFLDQGETALKPLTMAEAATALDCHPATISRTTRDKLVLTPRGMIALADFFSPAVTGTSTASRAVGAWIAHIIESENPEKPLTDEAIAQHLADKLGIRIGRRAIAKHRAKHHIGAVFDRRTIRTKNQPIQPGSPRQENAPC